MAVAFLAAVPESPAAGAAGAAGAAAPAAGAAGAAAPAARAAAPAGADYYENIRDMEGAGGLRVAKSFKRKFKAIHEIIYTSVPSSSQTVDGNDSNGEDAPAGEDATGGAPEDAAAARHLTNSVRNASGSIESSSWHVICSFRIARA